MGTRDELKRLMPSEDAKLEALNQHYQNTFTGIQQYLRIRDTFFFLILLISSFMLFQMASPREAGNAITEFIAKKLAIEQRMDISFISAIIWFSLLMLTVRYYQTVVHIERQYNYISRLEKHLSSLYDGKLFTRESKSYLEKYPWFSDWAWGLYTIVFPILLSGLVTVKLWTEFSVLLCPLSFWFWADAVMWLCLIISTGLYMVMLHLGK